MWRLKYEYNETGSYSILNGNIGTAREALTAMLLSNAGWNVEAAKNELSGDYVIKDNIDYPSSNTIPLWLLGMIY